MFVPEYSITPNILKHIANIEYKRAQIDDSILLPNFENKLTKEALIEKIINTFKFDGENIDQIFVKKIVEKISLVKNQKVFNLQEGVSYIIKLAEVHDFDDASLRHLHKEIAQNLIPDSLLGKYRSQRIPQKTAPEEILAAIVELFDWYNSLEAMETNPIILAGIIKGRLEIIMPFERYNFAISNYVANFIMLSKGYTMDRYFSLESYYSSTKRAYETCINTLYEDEDLTSWLEYFTQGYSTLAANTAEKIKLVTKDLKMSPGAKKVFLTPRQERLIEYIQDYGYLQNKQFATIFPDISEDSVLRDLKKLIDEGLLAKRGSTKSSRYELI